MKKRILKKVYKGVYKRYGKKYLIELIKLDIKKYSTNIIRRDSKDMNLRFKSYKKKRNNTLTPKN